MNTITDLLDLEDSDLFISDVLVEGTRKLITLETHPVPHFCPSCGYRMHSRGIKTRTVHHPILQDGYELILLLKQRRWRCTNPDCRFENNDEFRFVNQRRRTTNATDMLIVFAFRDLQAYFFLVFIIALYTSLRYSGLSIMLLCLRLFQSSLNNSDSQSICNNDLMPLEMKFFQNRLVQQELLASLFPEYLQPVNV